MQDLSATIARAPFGRTAEGAAVDSFTLAGAGGLELTVITYGGIVTSILVPDGHGGRTDVVLGFDTLEDYVTRRGYFGALIGRYGNRIANGRFTLDGREYQLSANDGANHLHGGTIGFNKAVWRAEPWRDGDRCGLMLGHHSPAGDQGYPGTLDVRVVYTVTPSNDVTIEYEARTDSPTILNLTQHSYFNLAGDASGDILDHQLTIDADRFTPTDAASIPTGELAPVDGTPFDFTRPTAIGDRIDARDEQIRSARGYDHNWALNRMAPDSDGVAFAARLRDPRSGRTLEVFTSEPGVQFYSGNKLGSMAGKRGAAYNRRSGLCLETQHFPDSPNRAHFPSTVLRPGQRFRSRTVWAFR